MPQEELQQLLEQTIEQIKKILERLKSLRWLSHYKRKFKLTMYRQKYSKNRKSVLFYPNKKYFFLEYHVVEMAEHDTKRRLRNS